MRRLIFRILFLLLLVSISSNAECQDTARIVTFRVVNAISGNPVVLAYIVNNTQMQTAIADLLGYFKVPVSFGDTINISSLGYFSQYLYCWGQYNSDSLYYTIQLKPRSYQIKELKFSWFSNYDKFLKGVKELQLPLTKEELTIARITEYFNRSTKLILIDIPQVSSGIPFGKDWLAKQSDKLKEQLEKEQHRRAIERKYSAGIVEALTELKGNELFWFMEYCAFTDEYLLNASDYDIRLKIVDKLKVYKINRTSKEKK